MHGSHTQQDRERELDSGGFGRLDISDLAPATGESPAPKSCDWCREPRSGEEYVVVADNRHFLLCPTCWGRSATYVELRQGGMTHGDAVARLTPS